MWLLRSELWCCFGRFLSISFQFLEFWILYLNLNLGVVLLQRVLQQGPAARLPALAQVAGLAEQRRVILTCEKAIVLLDIISKRVWSLHACICVPYVFGTLLALIFSIWCCICWIYFGVFFRSVGSGVQFTESMFWMYKPVDWLHHSTQKTPEETQKKNKTHEKKPKPSSEFAVKIWSVFSVKFVVPIAVLRAHACVHR